MNSSFNSTGFQLRLKEPANRYLYFLASLLKRILMILNCRSLWVRTYESQEADDGNLHRIIYIGNLENIAWIEKDLLSKHLLTDEKRISAWKCNNEVIRCFSAQNTLIVDINRILADFLPSGGFRSYPWIRQVIWLDSENFKKRRSRIMSEFRRVMRKYNYSTGITSDKKDTDYFYKNLYLPFVAYRFKSTAVPRSHSEIWNAVKKGFILQVFYKGEWIAGDIVRISGKEIQGMASGLLADYNHPSRKTARTVMYPILFEWALTKGYRKINLLRSRANLRDGVFDSKLHRGAAAEVDSWPHSALQFYIPENSALPKYWETQLVLQDGRMETLLEARK